MDEGQTDFLLTNFFEKLTEVYKSNDDATFQISLL